MSYLSNSANAAVNSLISNYNTGVVSANGNLTTITTDTSNSFKTTPTFKMEMFKSENGGFIMNLIKWSPNAYTHTNKLFILSDVLNMGRDIQNILATEILNS